MDQAERDEVAAAWFRLAEGDRQRLLSLLARLERDQVLEERQRLEPRASLG